MKIFQTCRRRWDFIAVACASALFCAATTPASGYFVHADAASQDFMAVSWLHNCWEFLSEKMTSLFVLTPVFAVLGPNPWWDTATLAIVAAIGLALVYEMTRELTGAPWAGGMAALFLAALPAYQFFSRVHIGYVLPFLLGGWLAIRRGHWGWAGFCFAMAPMSHFGAAVPVAVSVAALAVVQLRPANWKLWAAFVAGGLAPILAVEALFFAYTGTPFAWTRGTLAVGLRWSPVNILAGGGLGLTGGSLTWLPEVLAGSNGPVLSAALALALPAPVLLRKDWNGAAMTAASLLTALVFAGIAAGRPGFVSRSLAPLYPLWVIGAAVTGYWLRSLFVAARFQSWVAAGAAALLGVALVQTGVYIREFTQTPYPQLEKWFQRAIDEARPVRYQGLPWTPLYYLAFQGTELLVDDERWIESGTTGQDVLIFQDQAPAGIGRDGYTIMAVTLDDTIDATHPVLTGEAAIPRRYEIWWPQESSQPIGPQTFKPNGQVVYYYSGSGCATPPPYGGGTLYFYQLAWNKLLRMLGN